MGGIGIPIPPIIILALCALCPPAPIFPVCFGVGRLRCPKSPEAGKAGRLSGFYCKNFAAIYNFLEK